MHAASEARYATNDRLPSPARVTSPIDTAQNSNAAPSTGVWVRRGGGRRTMGGERERRGGGGEVEEREREGRGEGGGDGSSA